MNSQLVALIVEKNSADLETIVSAIGITTLLKLLPNVMNILGTVEAAQKALAVAPKTQ